MEGHKLLQETADTMQRYHQMMAVEGTEFNIFSILGLSSQEVRLHSTFIAELLDCKGAHSLGNSFLLLFLEELTKISKHPILQGFNTDCYTIEVEKLIGTISKDFSHGGRIDICLCDNNNNRIIIENKIYASDQEKQLLRYHHYDPKALLIYLTLQGGEASCWSTGDTLKKDEHYFCVSYKKLITDWLKKCIMICQSKLIVKNTIEQYLNIVKNFTEQSYTHKMSEEIITLLSNNKDFFCSAEEIGNAYHTLKRQIYIKFKEQLEATKPDSLVATTLDNYRIKYIISEDWEGFYYGFIVEKDGKQICGN